MKLGAFGIECKRVPTSSGEERRLEVWRFARWHLKIIWWRGL